MRKLLLCSAIVLGCSEGEPPTLGEVSEPLTTCDSVTCPNGCCSGLNCLPGNDPINACGTKGSTCVRCPTDSPECYDGKCVPCDSTNCATGCCRNNVCYKGISNSDCGKGGEQCRACNSSETCDSTQNCTSTSGGSNRPGGGITQY